MRKSKLTHGVKRVSFLFVALLLPACGSISQNAADKSYSFGAIDYTNPRVTGVAPAKYTRTIFSSTNF